MYSVYCAFWKRSSLRTSAGSSQVVPEVPARLHDLLCEELTPRTWFLRTMHTCCQKEVTLGHLFMSTVFSLFLNGPRSTSQQSTPVSQQTWELHLLPQHRSVDVSTCHSVGAWTLTASLSTAVSGGQEPTRMAAWKSQGKSTGEGLAGKSDDACRARE